MRKFDQTYFINIGKIEFHSNLELCRKGQIKFISIYQTVCQSVRKYKQHFKGKVLGHPRRKKLDKEIWGFSLIASIGYFVLSRGKLSAQ